MAPSRRVRTAAALLLLLAPLTVHAQLSDLPDLSTATQTSDQTSAQSSAQSSEQSTAQSTGQTTNTRGTATTDDGGSTATTKFVATATDNTVSVTNAPSLTTGDATSVFHLISDVPTIAGAGVPELFIPWTAGAPFMQKSNLPEGTVFIAIGGILAFLGACVLLWRGMVAWSINRSVKRAALASVGAGEKSTWGGSSGYRSVSQNKASLYKDAGSSMSLDQLTSAGKPMKPYFRESTMERRDPPSDLFFSPTAKVNNRESILSHRTSSYMPSGFYASPNAAAAGGASATTLGGDGSHSIAPYAQRSSYMNVNESSPPPSPGQPATRSSQGYRSSRQGAESREALRPPPSREGRRSYLSAEPRTGQSSGLYAQPSSSSLMVGSNSVSDLGGSRAPSAYFEDLLENHGQGPRERF